MKLDGYIWTRCLDCGMMKYIPLQNCLGSSGRGLGKDCYVDRFAPTQTTEPTFRTK
ncbi:hypothetical protein SAMN05443661_13328 [Natronobacterium gregoryi]|uniref:Uncharacterized protein n=2 Tax=Natronobacterium gregoryi TaxID=44930 RepID=L0AIX7_NATGS|nr:hypothetical protein Natgr_2599 [Natronobacterium gregoryi SP2]SFJ48377.1 hypothetical protein SAMN05443661_13328 [Natronobacterium gregoryi]